MGEERREERAHGVRFEPPSSRRAAISRPRLLTRLHDRFTARVIVIVAPAGHGKTTLLAQAVADNTLAPRGFDCWLTCRPDDAGGVSLAVALCRALGATPPEDQGRIDRGAEAVIEAVWHRSPHEVALLLDDVHEIAPGSPGAELLARLVGSLPRNGHIVLSGRQPPPIGLSRLDVLGEVVRLTEDDLLFTADELAAFAWQRGVPVDRLSQCAGWPALAELAARAAPGVEAAYLWEEVLAGIEAGRRRALALLSHVGVFDDHLAHAVLGRDIDVASLTADLPLVATTADGGRQVHALWLPHLARVVTEAEIAEARRRAGVALAQRGDVTAAVQLLTTAGAWDEVTDVVTDALATRVSAVPGAAIAASLDRLPGRLAEAPLARLLGAIASARADPVAAQRDLEQAADAFRREGNATGELACMTQLARLAWEFEQPERLANLAARLFQMEELGLARAVPLACMTRALIAQVMGDCGAALAELDRIPAGVLSETWQAMADWLRAISLIHLGRLEEARQTAERACSYAGALYGPVVESARLQALWLLGEVDEVVDEAPGLVQRASGTGLGDFAAVQAASACVAMAAVGRPEDAVPYLHLARQLAGRSASFGVVLTDVSLVVAEAFLAVALADESRAARVLHDYVDRSPPLGTGLGALGQRWFLPLWYVLVPGSRAFWDAADLPPCFALGRDLARVFVAVRERGKLPTGAPRLPAPGVTRSLLPARWATELALAYIAAGRTAGWTLLDALWPRVQPVVRHHADDPGAPLGRPARHALARLPVPPRARLELALLGPIELTRDGEPVDGPEWSRERVRSLLAHLVLHRPVSRERLGADLWPALDPEAQSHNLRVNLAHLLRVLEPERAERDASFLVRSSGRDLLLHRGEWLGTDVWRFDELWDHATDADSRGLASEALDAMQRAVALWRGDPSELASDEWAIPEVEERRLRLVRLATRAGELLLARGDLDAARSMGEAALRVDPWSERSHRLVVAALAALGDHGAVRRAIDRCRSALAELGLDGAEAARRLEQLWSDRAATGGSAPLRR